MKEKEISTKGLVYTALATAMVCICTMLIKLPVASTGGYVNIGDAMIFIVAITLGKRKGAVAGGLGACLADVLSGYMIYAPATIIIKALEGYLCGIIFEKLEHKVNNVVDIFIASTVAACVMVFGYFIYEFFLMGYAAAIGAVLANIIQGVCSTIIAIPLTVVFRQAFKRVIHSV